MVDDKFNEWLDGVTFSQMTRREHAEMMGANLENLKWAFTFGWLMCLEEVDLKKKQE
jgi:hypothetical protein